MMQVGQIAELNLQNSQVDNGLLSRLTDKAAQADKTASAKSVNFADLLCKASAKDTSKIPSPFSLLPSDHPESSPSTPSIDTKSELYKQCEALESYIMKILLQGMRNTVPKNDLLNTGLAGNMYEDMLYDKYSETMAKDNSFGFAKMAYLELTGQRGKVMDPSAAGNAGVAGF
jgi:flagellar protein FlgJ